MSKQHTCKETLNVCFKIDRFGIITGAHDIQTQEQGNPTFIEIDEIVEVK